MNPREKAQLLIIIGFATARGSDVSIQHLINSLMEKRKKTEAEKDELLKAFEFAKDQGVQTYFSNSDMQILESAIKYEI